jgi:hypothetical protein
MELQILEAVVVVALVEQDWELGAMADLVLSSSVTLTLLQRHLQQPARQPLRLLVDLELINLPETVQSRSEAQHGSLCKT